MFDKLIPWKRQNGAGHNHGLSMYGEDDALAGLRREFDSALTRFWDDWNRGTQSDLLRSAVDFDEDKNQYVMTAKLPGFEPGEIDVKVSGNVLTVKAEHQEQSDGKNGRMHRYGSFYESFTLPSGVQADKIDASYHNGVLEVHVPKDETIPSKRIEVSVT